MAVMKKFLIVLALSQPLSARASDGKIVSERVGLNPLQNVRIEMDKGTLTLAPSKSNAMTYEVQFVFNDPDSGLFRIFSRKASAPADCAQCTVSYSVEKGLEIHSGDNYNAIAKIGVPQKQPLDVKLSAGQMDIGSLTGKIKALVVGGPALDGRVDNKRDTNCKEIGVTLRTQEGAVSVN